MNPAHRLEVTRTQCLTSLTVYAAFSVAVISTKILDQRLEATQKPRSRGLMIGVSWCVCLFSCFSPSSPSGAFLEILNRFALLGSRCSAVAMAVDLFFPVISGQTCWVSSVVLFVIDSFFVCVCMDVLSWSCICNKFDASAN